MRGKGGTAAAGKDIHDSREGDEANGIVPQGFERIEKSRKEGDKEAIRQVVDGRMDGWLDKEGRYEEHTLGRLKDPATRDS